MINLSTIESILTLVLAYFVVTTISGCFSAWVSKYVGDHTAEYAGLLTLNPIAHIDPIGLTLLIVFGFGWGRYVPINPYFIEEPHQKAKTIFAYYADTIILSFLAFSSLMLLLKTFGLEIIALVKPMLFTGDIYLPLLAEYYPDSSSFTLVIGVILVAIVYLSALLAVIELLLSSFKLILLFFTDMQAQDDFLLFIIPMLIIYFLLVGPLRKYFMFIIVEFAKFLFGIVG